MKEYKQINKIIKSDLSNFDILNSKNKNKIKFLIMLVSFSLTSLLVLTVFLVGKVSPDNTASASQQVVQKKEKPSPFADKKKPGFIRTALALPKSLSRGITEPTTILALGRPGQGYSGGNLTDTILLIHIDPTNEQKAVLISLPRDFLVKTSTGRLTKINSLYSFASIDGLAEKITEITGLDINHYIIVDIVVVKEIITLVDGLNVFVPQDIDDPTFPGPNHSYDTFKLKAGWRYLDGDTALRYIRTRYTSPNGDFDRMARQQQIIQLLKRKVLSLNLLWDLPTYLKLYDTLQEHIETDLSVLDITSLWHTTKEIQPNKITSVVIDKKETGLLRGDQVLFGSQKASVVYPREGQENYNKIREYIEKFIN